ncbi:MAG: prepilin-type N-terminal cleavage/methylation domain-containing protein [Candidatus Omnitrophica bacterium]|nr:prepilin-type N-terminal cleavage/methylation domain-containing protein [Candidatus Omnitrophota bacterium]
MKKIGNNSGFTLIEIIVVLIIVGILAAIALPNLFSNIQKSAGAQALTLLDSYKTPIESCLQAHYTTVPNAGQCTLAGQNLNAGAQNGWTVSIAAAAVAQGATVGTAVAPAGTVSAGTATYTLVATDAGAKTITLTRNAAGIWSCATGSASPYTGIC